jgi:hypothetical protein
MGDSIFRSLSFLAALYEIGPLFQYLYGFGCRNAHSTCRRYASARSSAAFCIAT